MRLTTDCGRAGIFCGFERQMGKSTILSCLLLIRLITSLSNSSVLLLSQPLPLPCQTMRSNSLYHLLHLQLGCPGQRAMELFLNGRSVVGLPTNIPIPDSFACPVCMREKQPSLVHGPPRESPMKVLGELLHMDFGFYKIRSCRGFTCF